MRVAFSLNSRTSRLAAAVAFTVSLAIPFFVVAQEPTPTPPSVNVTQEPGPPKRIPRQQALSSSAVDGIVREQVSEGVYRPVATARIQLKNLQTGQPLSLLTGGDGAFRIVPVVPGSYELDVQAAGYATFHVTSLAADANEVLTLEITLVPATMVEMKSPLPCRRRPPRHLVPIANSAIASIPTPTTSWNSRPMCCRPLPTCSTPCPIAGRSNSRTIVATPRRANTFMSSRVGTTRSTAIASRAMNQSGQRCWASRSSSISPAPLRPFLMGAACPLPAASAPRNPAARDFLATAISSSSIRH